MKFEKPIAEIQRFDLKDVISASGETTEEEFPLPDPTNPDNPQLNTWVGEEYGSCYGSKLDNLTMQNCL